MIELVKKALYTGVGLAMLTKEKLVELGKEVSEHAQLSEAQAKEFQDELQRRAEEAKRNLEAQIDQRVEQVVARLGLVRAEQHQTLMARVESLEKALGEHKAHHDGPRPS